MVALVVPVTSLKFMSHLGLHTNARTHARTPTPTPTPTPTHTHTHTEACMHACMHAFEYQSDFSVKVKGQTKTAQQLNKRAGTTREIPERLKIHSLTLQVGTN